jgi:hypothetical protein
MDQRRRLQRMPGALGSHFLKRDGPQFRIDLLVEPVHRVRVSGSQVSEEACDIAHAVDYAIRA